MIKPEDHWRVIRYLKSPMIDLGGGVIPSEKAVKVAPEFLATFKDRSINSICVDGIREPGSFMPLWNVLNDGGCLISANPMSDDTLKIIRKNTRFQLIETAPYWVIRKLSGPNGEVAYQKPVPAPGQKTICMVRYGALGDHIQMSCVIDYYHKEGWWIAYNCNKKGRDVFRGDPRINEYIDHEDNVIPADKVKLKAYWDNLAAGYDKFVSFAEVAEKTLLRIEGRQPEYKDSYLKRHCDCSKNYYDAHFERCGLQEIKGRRPVIWLSEKEKEWARKEVEDARKKTGKSFIVLWNIMGSSFHKMYPWAYDVWYLCMHNQDDIGFITVSDQMGAFLEEKKFKNTFPRAGKYSIRHTMALHSAVDAVVSTETNSMNIGLGFDAPVIALLSHSDKSQFPWKEHDIPLSPSMKEVPCYPCHQLHYSRNSCPRGLVCKDATLCMDSITPGQVYESLMRLRDEYNTRATA